MTQQLLQIFDSASVAKLKNGSHQLSSISNSRRLRKPGQGSGCFSRGSSQLHRMINSSLTASQIWHIGRVKIRENFSHVWKNYSMSYMRTTPPTGSNQIAQLSFKRGIIRRMLLLNMQTILLKHTTNSCLLRFSKPQLQKMFANCFRTKIKQDSLWMRPIKCSSGSTGWNKTNASLQQSMCTQSRIIRIKTLPTWIPMWLLSGHNVHHNNSSASNRATTVEIAQEDKTPTEATITATDHRRIKATMLPEMVNFLFTARSSTTHKKNAAKELMIRNLA